VKNIFLVLLTVFCSFIPTLLYSQVDTAWIRSYNGPGNISDNASAIAVDRTGNVYVTGSSFGAGTDYDYATIKYNSAGDMVWVRRYNGPVNGDDHAYAMALDNAGNVYVTGASYGSGTNHDYATIKYNSAGDTIWVRRYHGPVNGESFAYAIAVDTLGNSYVTGMDVGSGSGADYATIKYNSNGDTVWLRRYNGPANNTDDASAIAVDRTGNVYVTGSSRSANAFDDYVTIKYNSNGVQQWVARYNGAGNDADEAKAIAVDAQGNVYVTGYSYSSGTNNDYLTIKYNSSGDTAWVRPFNGSGNSADYAYAIAVDESSNVYVTGGSYGSGTSLDITTVKYNSTGVREWLTRYNGSGNSSDVAYAMVLDNAYNIYVTGTTYSTGTNGDYATIKYNPSGIAQWVRRYNGPGNGDDAASAIAIDNANNIYVTGSSFGAGANYDYTTIKYVQGQGIEEIASLPLAKTSGVEVYPNPAKTFFTVGLSLNVQSSMLRIYDVTGKMVKEIGDCFANARNDGLVRISLEGIKNGVYFVKVNEETNLRKIIITK
jgi:uncharacterized delta-60 repeat protein